MSEASIAPAPALPKPAWRLNLILFVVTLGAVFITALDQYKGETESIGLAMSHGSYVKALQLVGSIMTILVAHEFGHYITARLHKVDASLPFFIPAPILSPFGTMGAVIRMRGTIPTRRALLDIGASGPLAGMVFAIPLYIYGVAHSQLVAIPPGGTVDLGESVVVRLLDHFFAPGVPDGMTLMYSPIAFGAWGGMFVTMINMLPVGQLDGGHVAYALFGPRQDRFAITIQRSMLVFFGVIMLGHVMRDVSASGGLTAARMSAHFMSGMFWLVWSQVLAVLGTVSRPAPDETDENAPPTLGWRTRLFAALGLAGLASLGHYAPSLLLVLAFVGGFALLVAMEIRSGVFRKHELFVHPPTGPDALGPGRKAVAIVTLALFALLFMPEPFSF